MKKRKTTRTRRPDVTEETKALIRRDRATGMSHRELAAKYEVARTSVGRICLSEEQRETRSTERAIILDAAVTLRSAGLSYAEIARRLGETVSRIHRLLVGASLVIGDGEAMRECSGCGDEATRADPICPACMPRFDHPPVLHRPIAHPRHTHRTPRHLVDEYATARPGGGE